MTLSDGDSPTIPNHPWCKPKNRVKSPRFELRRAFWSRVLELYPKIMSENTRVATRALFELDELKPWLPAQNAVERRLFQAAELRKAQITFESIGVYAEDQALREITSIPRHESRRGRPRIKLNDAYRGYDLHFKELKTWREIVLEIRGSCRDRGCKMYCSACNDVNRSAEATRRVGERCSKCDYPVRPAARKSEVCYKCADAMSNLVNRLSDFASGKGIYPPGSGRKSSKR